MNGKVFEKGGFVRIIIVILLVLVSYAQYFIVIPLIESVRDNERNIYEIELKIEKYQIRNVLLFEDILRRFDDFQ